MGRSRVVAGGATMSRAIDRFKEGDDGAAAEVIAEHAPLAYAVAYGVLRDASAAERVVSEVLTDALLLEGSPFASHAAERFWIADATRRRALGLLRAAARGRGRRPNAHRGPPVRANDGWEAAAELLSPEAVCEAFEALKPSEQEAISLAYVNGLRPVEIGRLLGLSEQRARDRLRNGLLYFQDSLLTMQEAAQ